MNEMYMNDQNGHIVLIGTTDEDIPANLVEEMKFDAHASFEQQPERVRKTIILYAVHTGFSALELFHHLCAIGQRMEAEKSRQTIDFKALNALATPVIEHKTRPYDTPDRIPSPKKFTRNRFRK